MKKIIIEGKKKMKVITSLTFRNFKNKSDSFTEFCISSRVLAQEIQVMKNPASQNTSKLISTIELASFTGTPASYATWTTRFFFFLLRL